MSEAVPLTALQRAVCWLRAVLRTGPLPVREVESLAQEVGISRRTVRRARAKLGVKSWPVGFGGRHAIALPEHADGDGPQPPHRRPGLDHDVDAFTSALPAARADRASTDLDRDGARELRKQAGVRHVRLRRLR